MTKVMFISDLHLGHKNLIEGKKFSFDFGRFRVGETIEEHDEKLVDRIASSVNKRDILYILGDVVVFHKDVSKLHMLSRIPGELRLVLGNHDLFPVKEYFGIFNQIEGFMKYKKSWLSHCPVHPAELFNKFNIHGHVHINSIPDFDGESYDKRYINVCVEALNGYPISYQDIINGKYWEIKHC